MVAIPKGFVRVPCFDDACTKKRMNYDLLVEEYQKKNIAAIKMSDLHVSAMNRKYIVSNTQVYKSLVYFLKLFHYQILPNPIYQNLTQSCMYVIEFD